MDQLRERNPFRAHGKTDGTCPTPSLTEGLPGPGECCVKNQGLSCSHRPFGIAASSPGCMGWLRNFMGLFKCEAWLCKGLFFFNIFIIEV